MKESNLACRIYSAVTIVGLLFLALVIVAVIL